LPLLGQGFEFSRWASARNRVESLRSRPASEIHLVRVSWGKMLCFLMQHTETTFTCLYCHHEKAVSVKLDKKEGVAYLNCKVCSQGYQSKVNRGCLALYCARDTNFLLQT
jgi:Transcription elongation factor Elf1 like